MVWADILLVSSTLVGMGFLGIGMYSAVLLLLKENQSIEEYMQEDQQNAEELFDDTMLQSLLESYKYGDQDDDSEEEVVSLNQKDE